MKLNNDSGNCSRLNHTQRLQGNIYWFLLTFYPFLQKSSVANKSIGFVAPPLRFQHERTHFRIRTRIWNFIKKDDELSVSKTEETPDEKSERYFSESPETDGLLFYLWTFSAIIFDSISFFSSSNPFLRE